MKTGAFRCMKDNKAELHSAVKNDAHLLPNAIPLYSHEPYL